LNVDPLDHPPYSPDLNPIEYAWVELKRRLHEKYPDLCKTPGNPDTVKAHLTKVLPKIWEELPQSVFEKLWKSTPDRVQAVIDAKGWYTHY